MGRTTTPKNVIDLYDQTGRTTMVWYGRVSETRLLEFVVAMQKSYEKGGVNEHLTDSSGGVLKINKAAIRENYPGSPIKIFWVKGN